MSKPHTWSVTVWEAHGSDTGSHLSVLRCLSGMRIGSEVRRISSTAGSSGIVIPREDVRKTTYSGAVKDANPRSRRFRRVPIGPRIALFRPRTFQPSASSSPQQDRLPAPPTVEARQQNSLGSHPTGHENLWLLRAKRAAPPAPR